MISLLILRPLVKNDKERMIMNDKNDNAGSFEAGSPSTKSVILSRIH